MKRKIRDGINTGWVIALVLIFLLITGCAKKKGGGFAMPPMPVDVATVNTGTVADRFEAVGTREAVDAITVVAQIDGQITAIPFEEGAVIEKGGLIAQLDDAQLKAEEARAEALRDQKKISYERIKSIVEQKAGAPQDLDDAAAALKMAEADLALIQARLAKTKITAPFTGLVGARRVSNGAFARTGDAITDLAKIDELRIIFYAPERYIPQLRKRAAVDVSSPAYPGVVVKGRISVVEPVVDPQTRSVKIIARIANAGRKFRPGMSANVSAVLSERKGALLIPDEAVFAEGNQNLVYVIQQDSSVVRTPVTLGARLSDAVEVLQGLSAGTQIVTAGHQKLFPGAKVFPVPNPGAGAPAGGKS